MSRNPKQHPVCMIVFVAEHRENWKGGRECGVLSSAGRKAAPKPIPRMQRSKGVSPMSDITWDEMDGWEKAWEVTKVVGGLVLVALPFLLGGKAPPRPRGPAVWRPKFYRPTGVSKGWKY